MRKRIVAFRILLVSLVLWLTSAVTLHAEEPVELAFNVRPPFKLHLADGSCGGTSCDFTRRAFEAAKVAFVWKEMPLNREFAEIEANQIPICAIAYYHTPERERIGLFSHPIDLDEPFAAVVSTKLPVPEDSTLEALVNNPGVMLELRTSRSYGPAIDALLKDAKAQIEWNTLPVAAALNMIRNGRPVATLITETELKYFGDGHDIPPDIARVIRFPDRKEMNPLSLVCSRKVGPERMTKINQAIDALGPNRH